MSVRARAHLHEHVTRRERCGVAHFQNLPNIFTATIWLLMRLGSASIELDWLEWHWFGLTWIAMLE